MLYTNKFNLPQSLVDVIVGGNYDLTESDPKRIGITTLINPPKIRLLTVRHWNELEEDVADHLWRITGSAYHYILAKTKEEKRLIEEKIEEIIDDITVVAKLDLYDDETKHLEDYKITTVWAVKEIKDDWVYQLNCYAWFLRKAGFEVKKAFINAILRDWSKSEYLRYGGDYPPIPFKRIEIPLWTMEEQEKFIRERVALYKKSLTLQNEDDIPICSAKERWKTEDKFAVYKNENKTATRVLDTKPEAEKYILELGDTKNKYKIVERKGVDNRCAEYCLVSKFCNYGKQYIK